MRLPSKTLSHYRGSPLKGSPNTAYAAHFVCPNFGFAETSHILGTFGGIGLA
jgi:hypothetical protein